MAAARAGDEQAFATIVRRHERALRGYAAKLLRGTGLDPADVVQDVFVRAHAALAGGSDARDLALKPRLIRMTRNRVIDVLRAVPGARVVLGQTIVRGTRLPAGRVQIERSVRLPPVQRRSATVVSLTCPARYVAQAVPSESRADALGAQKLEDPSLPVRARSRDVRVFWTRSARPHTATTRLGLVCSRRR